MRSRLPPRSGIGSWAMSSGGRSYSKSAVRSLRKSAVKDRGLPGGRSQAKPTIRQRRGAAAARGPFEEALLDEKRLVDLLQGSGIFADGHGHGPEADRTAAELLDDGAENP